MDLANLIKRSYGDADLIFASHSIEIEHARNSLIAAEKEDVGFKEFLKKHRDFLRSENCSDEHIENQIRRVKNLSNYFRKD